MHRLDRRQRPGAHSAKLRGSTTTTNCERFQGRRTTDASEASLQQRRGCNLRLDVCECPICRSLPIIINTARARDVTTRWPNNKASAAAAALILAKVATHDPSSLTTRNSAQHDGKSWQHPLKTQKTCQVLQHPYKCSLIMPSDHYHKRQQAAIKSRFSNNVFVT